MVQPRSASTSPTPKSRGSILHNRNGTEGQNDQYIQEKHFIMCFGDVNVSARLDSASCWMRLNCRLLTPVLRKPFYEDNIAQSFFVPFTVGQSNFNESDAIFFLWNFVIQFTLWHKAAYTSPEVECQWWRDGLLLLRDQLNKDKVWRATLQQWNRAEGHKQQLPSHPANWNNDYYTEMFKG